MSLNTPNYAAESTAKDRLVLFKLRDASEYPRWKMLLQDHLFKKLHNTNMDKLTTAATLDAKYFAAHPDFKEECKTASKDANNDKVDPLSDPDFCGRCKIYAFEEGEGFQNWLYTIYADVRAALSDKIHWCRAH